MGVMPQRPCRLKDGRETVLRSVLEIDAEATLALRVRLSHSCPYIATAPGEVTDTPADQARRIREFLERPTELLIVAEAEGRCIGAGSLHSPRRPKLNHCVDLGIALDEGWRGQGLGRAMMSAMLDWAADHPAIEKVTLGVAPENAGAVALYESLGFAVEGVQRGQMKQADGRRLDNMLMAVWVKPGLAPDGRPPWTPGSAGPEAG